MRGFIRISMRGLQDLEASFAKLEGKAKPALFGAMRDGAHKVVRRAKEGLATPPKSGRIYRRGKTRRHQASAPGEYPASDTGNLLRSVHDEHDDQFGDGHQFTAEVVAATEYAAPLERKDPYDGGRPFLSRALTECAPEILADVERRMKDVFDE